MSQQILLDGQTLTLEALEAIARGAKVALCPQAARRMQASRDLVERIADGDEPVYGINTGFGALAETPVAKKDLARLQRNLVVSHAVGVGAPLGEEQTRALMALRANVLARGVSGVRTLLVKRLIIMLNQRIYPLIPCKGSVGASGDLAPLAHLAMGLIGEGKGRYADGPLMPMGEVLASAGLQAIELAAKEGLGLTNGTQAMLAVGSLALLQAERLADLADISGACSLEGLLGTNAPFSELIMEARPHAGQKRSAERLRALLANSEVMKSHSDCGKVQDPYSLRCMPQVHGATRGALAHIRSVLEVELNSATDNPLIFADEGLSISGGNFHGQPLALALDYLAIATAELANIAERRIEQLVNPALSGLPAFLTPRPGLNSGFMITQVTAAALINENKVLCHPASVDSIPSSANREDHVSMGMTSANKACSVIDNVALVLGIELMTACQALEFHQPLKAGAGVQAAYELVRTVVMPLEEDRALSEDMEAMDKLLRGSSLRRAAEEAAGLVSRDYGAGAA
jgi:histidine ammonia-lyase